MINIKYLIALRIILCLYVLSVFILYILDIHNVMLFTKYLTLWGFVVEVFYFVLIVIENVTYKYHGGQFFDEKLWKIIHVLFEILFSA